MGLVLPPALVEWHWSTSTSPTLFLTPHPLRQWADTFPWAALVAAIECSFAQRFPPRSCEADVPCPSGCCWP